MSASARDGAVERGAARAFRSGAKRCSGTVKGRMIAGADEGAEAAARNAALTIEHGGLPAYAYWDPGAVGGESREERYGWWWDLVGSTDPRVAALAWEWVKRLRAGTPVARGRKRKRNGRLVYVLQRRVRS